tara:strand:+ start:3243 stop:3425 length:183 start_codon:yes stop_codon:yes gene_type:complete
VAVLVVCVESEALLIVIEKLNLFERVVEKVTILVHVPNDLFAITGRVKANGPTHPYDSLL